ncbi:MAG: sarcosine oxidase subunit beta family protein [Gammaproteobacteria bacterium]|jgi:sarcosine oxidase subunit beta|nr:sarcosine oxidase subunit beta family protein [Gammaproteobacteria bacterium]
MGRYNALNIVWQALQGNQNWQRVWRDPQPKAHYDVIIIGGGGHGLATAYYLAKLHGITRVAVLEKGWLGGGNVGRNTTIVRSNYMLDGNAPFYEHGMNLWRSMAQDLNYNVMFSPRGVLNLAHNKAQYDEYARRGNAMRLNGIDAEILSRDEVLQREPILVTSAAERFPIFGGLLQPQAGNARHDAVAWGYARAADRLGVDLIQNCEVVDFIQQGEKVVGVTTNRGDIYADKVGMAVAGNTSRLTSKLGLHLPIESHVLQAFVTEPYKPVINGVVTYGGGGHFYISQSNKGGLVFGGDIDGYNSYAQRGNLPVFEDVITAGLSIMPSLSRVKLLRNWGGIMDMSMDGSPIIDTGPIDGLYLNTGWCYGGFKATPASGWCFAYTIANNQAHALNKAFTLDRFAKGYAIDEKGAGPYPKAH